MKHSFVMATVSALALTASAFSPALAGAPNGFTGTLSGEYANVDIDCGGCGDIDSWGVNAAAAYGIAPDLGVQLDGNYHNLSGNGGGDLDIWGVGGSAFWAPSNGRLGATVQYSNIDTVDADLTVYGAFGELYIADEVTVAVKGGGFSASIAGFNDDGGYLGAGVTAYVMPNLAISGTVDYLGPDSGGSASIFTGRAEYLLPVEFPVAVYGGYRNTNVSGLNGSIGQWFIGLTYYTDGNGSTLVEKHRNGALNPAFATNFTSTFF